MHVSSCKVVVKSTLAMCEVCFFRVTKYGEIDNIILQKLHEQSCTARKEAYASARWRTIPATRGIAMPASVSGSREFGKSATT